MERIMLGTHSSFMETAQTRTRLADGWMENLALVDSILSLIPVAHKACSTIECSRSISRASGGFCKCVCDSTACLANFVDLLGGTKPEMTSLFLLKDED